MTCRQFVLEYPRLLLLGCVVVVSSLLSTMVMAADDAAKLQYFRQKIEPVLKTECFGCHSKKAEELSGGLRLDSRDALLRGGDTGPAIVPGQPDTSLLLQAMRHADGLAMPPKKKLSAAVLRDFAEWIKDGAVDPRVQEALSVEEELRQARNHWAFLPLRKPAVPEVSSTTGARNDIDRFILKELERRNWPSAPEASRSDYVRRVYFDLIGLPPTPEQVAVFVTDTRPDAVERLVDELLASRHYGEHWATHWLDVVRFAESEGYEYDRHIPDAWRYRDYVIASLNQDKPFNQFLTEQLAGDELDPANHEYLSAAIFHRLGPVRRNAGNPDIALSRNEVLTERTDIIGSAVLGLTIGCARCHNHKLEPITQKDYYRLQAFFAATQEHNLVLASADEQAAWQAETTRLKSRITELQKQAKAAQGEEKTKLETEAEELEDQLPDPLATIPTIQDVASQRTVMHVLKRGVWEQKGDRVGPRPPSVLVPEDEPELSPDIERPRQRLAQWLTSPQQPLTARVLVNRLWQQHFGIGLVKTANDFGLHGERPSHPQLLDYLANRCIELGWRLKPLHREIVLSRTYRQGTRLSQSTSAEVIQRDDPENRWLSHYSARRLTAEQIRDAMLHVSGRLNPLAGGPSVVVPADPELVRLLYRPAQWTVTKDPREHDRRSIYLIAKRNLRLPFFESLDAPPLLTSCGRREASTHPPQALELMNGTLSNQLAIAFASRLHRECGDDRAKQVDRAFQLALNRAPTNEERTRSLAFLQDQPPSEFTLALFNLHEFLQLR